MPKSSSRVRSQGPVSETGSLRERTLACKRCQYKKLKCSRTVPCDMCQKARVACEYRQLDRKRKPASQDHLKLLQSRLSWLENFIVDLQNTSPSEMGDKLTSVSFISTSSRDDPPGTAKLPPSGSAPRRAVNLHVTSDGSLSFHGPTSIYQAIPRPGERALDAASTSDGAFKNADHVLQYFNIDINDDTITQALILFFKWQYPNFMFIYRDAFLRDHFGERKESKYWSLSLALAICALGSLMLPQKEQKDYGARCHNAAESIAMVTGLTHPSVKAVQTFLCLAFYEIGSGNPSKGWAFSGIAFRMAQDLGFQKDPATWAEHESLLNNHEDVEVRRRIYWGCYISDKLISLVLGRPVQLLYAEAEVRELETQPDPPFVLPWRSVGFDEDSADQQDDMSMIPYIKEQIKLSRIVERLLSLLSSASSQNHSSLRRQDLESLNYDLLKWRTELAERAEFMVWDAIDKPLKPSLASLHFLYNSARIALNFDEGMSSVDSETVAQARETCIFAAVEIHSLMRRFRNQHGLKHSPLMIVYGMAQAIRALEAFGTPEETKNLKEGMSEIATTWQLAKLISA